jgi:hypothetical protein
MHERAWDSRGRAYLRSHQQNTAGESNPAHFSVNEIRAGVSLDDSDNHFARIHRQNTG